MMTRLAVFLALLCGAASVAPAQDVPGDLASLKPGQTRRVTSADPDWRQGQNDWTSVQPGQTLVLADLSGPGEIRHLWNTVNCQEQGHPRLLRLRIYWDGEDEPSVDAPLGDFFAGGHGMNVPMDSSVVRVTGNGRARNCYWPMPFRKSAKITLTNEGRRGAAVYYYVDWQKLDAIPDDAAYFHAEYRQSFPAPPGDFYTVADISGRGHYVGTVLGCVSLARGWWGEGDDLFFLDGDADPTLAGTGLEDYFCDAFGFVQQSGPSYGTPLYEGLTQPVSRTVAYRWHLADPITFDKSLRFQFEHRGVVRGDDGKIRTGVGERPDDYSSVAFWYQVEPHRAFPPMPVGYARLGYGVPLDGDALLKATSATAGEVVADVHTHRGAVDADVPVLKWTPTDEGATLTITLPADQPVHGLRLSCRTTPDGGRYDVTLDGQPVGKTLDFYGSNPQVVLTDLDLPEPLPAGEHKLTFAPAGKADKSAGRAIGVDAVIVRVRPRP